ncbi:hypothetical protein Peur_040275 [Populus x canadensis]
MRDLQPKRGGEQKDTRLTAKQKQQALETFYLRFWRWMDGWISVCARLLLSWRGFNAYPIILASPFFLSSVLKIASEISIPLHSLCFENYKRDLNSSVHF